MALTDNVPSNAFDVLKRNMQDADKFVNSPELTFDNRPSPNGNSKSETIAGITKKANDVIDGYRAQYIGAYALPDKTFELPGQFVVYGNNAYAYVGAAPLPYTTDIATYPDPNSDPNLQLSPSVTALYVQQQANAGDSQIVGGNIHPVNAETSAQLGDTGLVNVEILRSSTFPYRIDRTVNGDITALDFDAGTATIGGVSVTIAPLPTIKLQRATDIQYLTYAIKGQRVQWLGYYEQSDGGSNWGTVKTGVHVEDGGLVFSIDANTYVAANHAGNRFSVKKFGARGGGADDTLPILATINAFRAASFESRARIIFPTDVYLCRDAWNFSVLGRVNKTIDGRDSTVNFENLGNRDAMVDVTDTRELNWKDIFLAYPGDFDRDPSECPQNGMLWARNAANDFAGRHKTYNLVVAGTFQLSAFYNAGTEENSHYSPEFRNNLLNRRSHVATCSNHLGATSEYSSITTTPISMTMNTYIRPRFSTDGAGGRESVCFRGVGGLTLINPYSTSGFTAHYALQAIDQSVSSVLIKGYQNEVDRGSSGANATCDIRIEGDGTKDFTGLEINEQLSTAANGILIDNPRRVRRSKINIPSNLSPFGGGINSGEWINTEVIAESGIDLSEAVDVTSCEVYANAIADIKLPSNLTRSTQVFAGDLDAPVSVGALKQKATATTIFMDALHVRLAGAGTVEILDSDVANIPYVAQKFYIDNANPANPYTIANNAVGGNIRTSTGADIVITTQILEVTYIGAVDRYYVTELG